MVASPQQTVAILLATIGTGFLVANLRIGYQLLRFGRLKSSALLTWPGRVQAYPRLALVMGIVLAVVISVKLVVLRRPPIECFGETMMLLYYVYLVPLDQRIGRGFYQEGLWLDSGFLPYAAIGGLTWREDPEPSLVVLPRMTKLARRLAVPPQHYAEARKLLREKIQGFEIHFTGKALDLGAHDEREDV